MGDVGENANLRRRMRSLYAILRTSSQIDIFGLLPEKTCRVSTDG
jgi:hypothetical protein